MTRQWMEQVMPDGRKYLYNPDTGERVWDEASDIRKWGNSNQNTWVEMTSHATGKKYYYNTLTKESVWELPNSNTSTSTTEVVNEKEKEHREQVFLRLLLEKNVGVEWTWEKTLKEIISHPDYRAIPTLAERKTLWERYIQDLKSTSTQIFLQVKQKCQHELFAFLDTLEVPKGGDFTEVKNALLDFTEFQQIRAAHPIKDSDYAMLFKEWRDSVEQRRDIHLKEKRYQAKEYLQATTSSLKLTEASRWADVKNELFSNARVNEYLCERILHPKDVLYAFEDAMEKTINHETTSPAHEEKNVDSLLKQVKKLISQVVGIEPDWPRVWKRLEQHPSLIELLPLINGPSEVLQVYWDSLDDNRSLYYKELPLIEEYVRKRARHIDFRDENSFVNFCKRKEDVSSFSCCIYFQQHHRERQKTHCNSNSQKTTEAEETKKEPPMSVEDFEIHRKRLIELFKYSLKHHYDPPITLGSNWNDYIEKIHASPEYAQLPDKSLARYYFEKYQKYLSKKLLPSESTLDAVKDCELLEDGEVPESDVKRPRY